MASKPRPRPVLKTREDYLIAFHDKLNGERKDTIDFLNYYILVCYGFIGLAVLIKVGVITGFAYQGATVDLKDSRLLDYIALLILLAYGLVGFHMIRLSNLFLSIRGNAKELLVLNRKARVVDVIDASLFASGILGIVIAVARSQTRTVLARVLNDSDLVTIRSAANVAVIPSLRTAAQFVGATSLWSVRLGNRLYVVMLRFLASVTLVLMPLILTVTYVLRDRVDPGSFGHASWPPSALWAAVQSVPLTSANALVGSAALMTVGITVVMILLIRRISIDLLEDFAARAQLTLQQIDALRPALQKFRGAFHQTEKPA